MSTTLEFDAIATAQVEAIYATPDVAATRIAAFRAASPRLGQTVVDVGCGPGFLVHELAKAVGPEGQVIGVDISDTMLALARRRCAGLNHVRLENAEARDLPLANEALDVACALQVYGYVKELDEALEELRRVVRPGGHVVILDTDFSNIVWESQHRPRMQKVMRAYDGHVAWPDLPRILPRRLVAAAFHLVSCEAVPIVTTNYHPNSFVFGIARFIHRFVTEHAGVPVEEADEWLVEFDRVEEERAFFFAMNRFLFVAAR
jgi:ubiquinone/menaquinone biosynthesis C-methylase UbiE